MVAAHSKNARTVKDALLDNRWMTDIAGEIAVEEAHEVLLPWIKLRSIELQDDVADTFSWPCSPDGLYSAKSTYDRLWEGTERFAATDCIWNVVHLSNAKSLCG
jgi:hypothetical protein